MNFTDLFYTDSSSFLDFITSFIYDYQIPSDNVIPLSYVQLAGANT